MDAGIFKEELKAPPKLEQSVARDNTNPYVAHLMDVFDDGGKITVFSGQACPIESSTSMGISMDALVDEVSRMHDPKDDYNKGLMDESSGNEELLDEMEKSDNADPSKIKSELEKKTRKLLHKCFDDKRYNIREV
jgi:hypothetical protein